MASQDNCEQDGVLPYMSAFKNHVELCLDSFRSLVESLVQSMKDLQFAELYFSPMIPQLGNGLVRLEIWTADIRINDPTFGKPSQPVDITSSQIVSVDLAETKYLTGILVNLKYVLEEVERRMHTMRPLIEKLSGNRFYDV